ncbi:MAG: hypothetical protein ABIS20_15580 [Thermoanaerobaculia bacterium]
MQPESRQLLAVSLAATFIVGGAAIVNQQIVLGCSFMAIAVPLLLWGFWPMIADQAKLKRERRRLDAERLQRDNDRAEARAFWREPCRAWDEFEYDAGGLVATMDNFRYQHHQPSNWQEIMLVKALTARRFAEALYESDRLQAMKLLLPFEKGRRGAEDFLTEVHLLRDWLRMTGQRYWQRKQDLGL